MNHDVFPPDPKLHHLMYARVKADATRLRNEEMARLAQGAGVFMHDATQRAARAANRLAARLRQHVRQRALKA